MNFPDQKALTLSWYYFRVSFGNARIFNVWNLLIFVKNIRVKFLKYIQTRIVSISIIQYFKNAYCMIVGEKWAKKWRRSTLSLLSKMLLCFFVTLIQNFEQNSGTFLVSLSLLMHHSLTQIRVWMLIDVFLLDGCYAIHQHGCNFACKQHV